MICEVPLNASFGSLVTYQPANLIYHEIYQGNYNDFTIQVYDQNMNLLSINDNEFVIHLVLVSADELSRFSGHSK
jgi:hypothetical protein